MSRRTYFEPAVHTLAVLLVGCLMPLGNAALAEHWSVAADTSNVAFVSVKNGVVAEAHTFAGVSGQVSAAGLAEVNVDLASVDTLIPLRDERMRNMLFEVGRFPLASFRAQLDVAAFVSLPIGSTVAAEVAGDLNLHGLSVPVEISTWVTRLAEDQVRVSSARPVILMAGAFELSPGLEALRVIAGLTSITPAVPVTFSLTLTRSHE